MLLVTAQSHHSEIDAISKGVDGLLAKPVIARHLYVELAHCLGILKDDAPATNRRQSKVMQWARFHHLDILLVEDVEINQEVILEMMSSVGLSARLAENGVEALAAVAEKKPDLILMDCQMPVMDGYEATRRLRAQAEYKDVPIIALTANAMVGDQENCFAAGMNAHVPKPINMDVLFGRMQQCLPEIASAAPFPESAGAVVSEEKTVTMPDFPGIDVAVGLAVLGGKIPVYLRILKKFRDKHGSTFRQQFEAAREAGDWDAQRRAAHSLKGAVNSLGAMQLGEAAFALEKAAKDQDAERCAELLPDVLTQLHIVIDGLAKLDDLMRELE